MSNQIDVARVLQFKNNLIMLSQQKGSRLGDKVLTEQVTGKSHFFERLGAATAVEKTSRHSPTPRMDSAHSRRKVDMKDWHWADMVDEEDQIRMLIDPKSKYAESAASSLGRLKDERIVRAAVGNAYGGESGSDAIALPSAQKLVPVESTNPTNLNVDALRMAKYLLDAADVDPSEERYIAVNASALMSMLGQTKATSSDYATVKALAQGEINTFMGFNFVRTEQVNSISSIDFTYDTATGLYKSGGTSTSGITNKKSIICWAKSGIGLATGKDITVRMDPRVDVSYALQVYAKASFEATRIEDAKVVEIVCSQ